MKKSLTILASLLLLIAIIGCKSQLTNLSGNNISGSLDKLEIELIESADTSKPMRVLQTDNLQDSLVLRKQSRDIIPGKDIQTIEHLIARMYSTVTDSASMGVGIAAPQIGISRNVILVQRFDKEGEPFESYLNPVISGYSKMKQDCREGCLSVPGIRGTTKNRSYAIMIEYNTLSGEIKRELVEGYTAVIFQHEIDHLRGILFYDHL